MEILGIIPARYNSTRLPGKPLADIAGKPMIWWTYQRAIQVKEFSKVFVATDNSEIVDVCQSYGIPTVLTSENHDNHILRIAEVAEKIKADYYVSINGDEPLITPECIKQICPEKVENAHYMGFLIRNIKDPVEVVDPSNIKVAVNNKGICVYMSRAALPYPKGTLDFKYKKFIGVECFNKSALQFFSRTEKGLLESIEDIDHLRFIENGIKVQTTLVESNSFSVDTKLDLEKMRKVLSNQL